MSSFIPDTIRDRMVATFTLLFVLVAAPLTLFLVEHAQNVAGDQAVDEFVQEVSIVASALSSTVDSGNLQDIQTELDSLTGATGFALAVYDNDGDLLASALAPGEGESSEFPPQTQGNILENATVENFGDWALLEAEIPAASDATVLARTDASDLEATVSGLWPRALLGMILAMGVVAALSWGVAHRISAPLENLRTQAVTVAGGDLSASVEPQGPRDIRELTVAFNTMTDRVSALIGESEDARKRLEMIFENLREGVLVVDSEEQVVAENRRAREILGSEGNPGVGAPFVVVVRDHELLGHLRSTQRSGTAMTIPIEYARSGLSIEATAIPVSSEREPFSIVVLRDVTEIRRLETVRREFVANVSHELRTPLASIRALADTLESGALDDPEVSLDFVQRIIGEVDRLTSLVEELLDLARLDSGRVTLMRKATQPDELVRSGVDRLRPQIERAGLSVSLDLPEHLPLVLADQARIEQVLLNLVHNAIKFTPPGGEIRIAARQVDGALHIEVSDTGQGIPGAELPRVFERFYKADRSRRSDGTGLGLAISKHIVMAHQGEIWVSSTLGEGSTFSFSLPLLIETGASPEAGLAIEQVSSITNDASAAPSGD